MFLALTGAQRMLMGVHSSVRQSVCACVRAKLVSTESALREFNHSHTVGAKKYFVLLHKVILRQVAFSMTLMR